MTSVTTIGRWLMSKGALGAMVIAVIAVLSAACAEPDSAVSPPTSGPVTLTIGYPHVTGQNPLHGMQQAARLVSFEGLVLPNRNGRVQPRLAESWTESADGLSWRFKLRANAFFHDGSPVDSMAVKESLQRSLANADIDSFPGLADIVAVEAANPTEVLLRLRSRSAFLLDDLGVAIQKTSPGRSAVGAGPYLTTSTSAEELSMRAFPKYYKGAPKIERIVWRSYPAVRTAWAAMMRRDVDFLYEVGPEAVEFLQAEASVQVFPFLRSYLLGVILNSRSSEFADGRVRRALNYAIDRDEIVQVALRGHGVAATGPAWPQHWAYDATLPSLSYDPSRASALLEAAGFPIRQHEAGLPSRLRFTAIFPENFALWERMALQIQRHLAEVGIDMQLETLSVNEFNRRIGAGEFEAVLTEFVVGNSPSRPYTFWYSGSRRNLWGYKNPAMDQAFDGIRRSSTEAEYREAFRRFQGQGIDDPPAIFVALGEISRAVSKRFQVIAQPGSDILHTIADWRLADPAARTTN